MSPTQKKYLKYITKFQNKNGYFPTIDQIHKGVGYSRALAHITVKQLVEMAYIEKLARGKYWVIQTRVELSTPSN